MSVTAFQDLPLADRDREWDGAAAEKRVRRWADGADEPNEKYRDAHVWYDSDKKDNFTAYKYGCALNLSRWCYNYCVTRRNVMARAKPKHERRSPHLGH